MAKDLYQVLGVGKDANDADIKKAYRKLAMEWHPDKHKGDKTAEQKFKEINQAYEVIGDRQKRQAYDQFGHAGANFSGGPGMGGFTGGQGGFDFGNMRTEFQGDSFSDIFEAFFTGFGARSNTPRKGRNLEFEIQISFDEAAFGTEKELMITRPDTTGKTKSETIKVKIPAGVDNGSIVRITGKGEPGINGGPQGDLYVHVRLQPHRDFVRNGFDVHSMKDISVLQAVLGDEIKVKTVDKEVTLKIPAGTQPGKVFKLKGYGVNKLHSDERGDHFVKINVVIPNKLNKKEKQLFQELVKESGMEPKTKGGFWG
jgi:molecular chaperone DnaJ